MTTYEKLSQVQIELHAPKNKRNTFGNYNYRSAEDILESVKPLCHKYGLVLTLTDDIKEVGGRIYVVATVTVTDTKTKESIDRTAMAREAESKKGQDDSQITGTASSYARKYALNGMFCIDDNQDADTVENYRSQALSQVVQCADRAQFETLQRTYLNLIKADEVTRRAFERIATIFPKDSIATPAPQTAEDITKMAMNTKK